MAEYALKNLKTTYVEQRLIKANKRSFRDTIRIKLIVFIDLFHSLVSFVIPKMVYLCMQPLHLSLILSSISFTGVYSYYDI